MLNFFYKIGVITIGILVGIPFVILVGIPFVIYITLACIILFLFLFTSPYIFFSTIKEKHEKRKLLDIIINDQLCKKYKDAKNKEEIKTILLNTWSSYSINDLKKKFKNII